MSVYVFRISEGNGRIIQDIKNGLLRQGWGGKGMSVEGSYEQFETAWRNKGWSDPAEYIKGKYRNLQILNSMKPEDIIVIPKLTLIDGMTTRSFTIVRVIGNYRFDPYEDVNDFGHIIPVEYVLSCPYDANDWSRNIDKKMRAYQSPVNNCWNSVFCDSVFSIIENHTSNPDDRFTEKSEIESLTCSEVCKNGLNEYLKSLVRQINEWSGQRLEKVIIELFEKNNYRVLRTNHYDRNGADVDIEVAALSEDSLGYELFTMNESMNESDSMPRICIQAKNKKGSDSGDKNGVKQLIDSKNNSPDTNASYILINLTEEFSAEAREEARKNNIMIINGRGFASLLVKYGMDVCLQSMD